MYDLSESVYQADALQFTANISTKTNGKYLFLKRATTQSEEEISVSSGSCEKNLVPETVFPAALLVSIEKKTIFLLFFIFNIQFMTQARPNVSSRLLNRLHMPKDKY